jgi:hypothetical protein
MFRQRSLRGIGLQKGIPCKAVTGRYTPRDPYVTPNRYL